MQRTGLLVPAEDVSALCDAIVELVGDPGLCDSYGKAGRQRMLEEFSVDRMISDHLRLYERVLDDGN